MSRITAESLRAALPVMGGERSLPGLEGPIVIHRDGFGIPHVRAGTEHDAFFGQGFVHAQDRLWQMEYDRLRARGRWSEAVGGEGLAQDKLMRRFQIWRTLEQDYAALSGDAQAMLQAYSSGVNAFLAGPDPLPVELQALEMQPEPWRAGDCLAVMKVRHIMMGVWEGKLWRARLVQTLGAEKTALLHPGYQQGQLLMLPPGQRFNGPILDGLAELSAGLAGLPRLQEDPAAGSNNWVAGGARTASGKPLVAGDPHRALDVPNVYYQNHLACADFDVVGFSFPGMPGFPHFAHNAHVAWSITHGQADYQDLFIEQFNPEQPARYRWQEDWREAEVCEERIAVRGEASVELSLYRTHHGPIIAGHPREGWGLAFCYTAMAAPNRTMDAVYRMLRAANADQLEEAQRHWVDPVNNMVYGDVHGEFGYRTRGELPLRPRANAWLPVAGWTGEYEWRGAVPFEEMPAARNPRAGYAYSANNRIVDETYPHYIALDFAPGFRAERINALLSTGSGLQVEDMGRMHGDVLSVPATAFKALYGKITPQDEGAALALQLLEQWDCQISAHSPAPLLFAAFRQRLLHAVLDPLLGTLAATAFQDRGHGAARMLRRTMARLHELIAEDDTALLPQGASWAVLMARALSEAVQGLQARLGGRMEGWRWDMEHKTGAVHLLSRSFPDAASLLDPPPIPMAGDGDTLLAGGIQAEQGFQVETLSTARYVFDTGDWNRSAWVIPGGASGHPGSPHYADQTGHFRELRMHPMLYDWDRIATQAESTQHLQPEQ
ncbi:MAG: penicillin acylase family protein [SAR324 cluster bacterium]|nr:penicillin acylase family protein [SAR324 cluster bacterium]MCZ6645305.1 penicillin acylase family protein [SAR324 cluster bacterium]